VPWGRFKEHKGFFLIKCREFSIFGKTLWFGKIWGEFPACFDLNNICCFTTKIIYILLTGCRKDHWTLELCTFASKPILHSIHLHD
jgi:hypothetical protein